MIMNHNNTERDVIVLIISVLIITLNILLFIYYWSHGGLKPSFSNIIEYAVRHNDPSVCHLAFSPMYCLKQLSHAESLTRNLDIGSSYRAKVANTVKNCTIEEIDTRLLCECTRNENCTLDTCQEIKNINAFDDCLEEAAVFQKDSSICDAVVPIPLPDNFSEASKEEWRQAILELCLIRVGRVLKNTSVCKKLADPYRYSNCLREIQWSIDIQNED